MFSVESFYAPQTRLSQASEEEGVDVYVPPEGEPEAAERNERYLRIMRALLSYAARPEGTFHTRAFVASLPDGELYDFCRDNALPDVLLTLYALGSVDLDAWRASADPVLEPLGEFESAWCLARLPEELLCWHSLRFSKADSSFRFTVRREGGAREIEMTDLLVEVNR